jgi:hypothetical protein
MTAHGTLYIDENCRDVFKDELDKAFGKDRWTLDGNAYDIWDMSQFPITAKVPVLDDETGELLGTAIITSRPVIVDEGMGRYIDVEPVKIKIKKETDEVEL